MKNYNSFQTIDEMTDVLQSMSVNELQEISNNSTFLFENKDELELYDNEIIDHKIDVMTDFLRNMSLKELRNLSTKTLNPDNLSIEQKILITGLDKWKIIRIETQKENATLKDILTYCDKLKIPYMSFMPELFTSQLI